MKTLLPACNIFGGAVVVAALFSAPPLSLLTKTLLIAVFIILPPLNLYGFFRKRHGLFIQAFSRWFRLALPTREENENHRKK